MCTYNGEKYLHQQLNSILNQTYPIYELIIQDDCSTDNTWNIILQYIAQFPTLIHAYRNQVNLGPHNNFKSAFKLATGDYIAPSDQDDIWETKKIEILMSLIFSNFSKPYQLAFAQDTALYEDGSKAFYKQSIEPVEKNIYGNHLYGHSTLFERKIISIYEHSEHLSFDLTLSLYFSIHRNFTTTEEHLVIWNRHESVCTKAALSGFSKKTLNKNAKVFFTLRHITKFKSSVITKVFEERSRFVNTYKKSGIDDLASKIAHYIALQSPKSLIKAGMMHVKILILKKEIQGFTLKNKIAAMAFAFRTPFVWWYDWHTEKYFE